MNVKEGRESRSFAEFEIRKDEEPGKEAETGEYIVEGYATTFDAPYLLFEEDGKKYYEEVARDAIDGADLTDVVFRFDHEGHVYARAKNGTLKISTDDHGMKVVCDLSTTESSREMYEEIKSGLIDKMSWAFVVDRDSFDKKTNTRRIEKIRKVYDVSAVTFPADVDTDISARSYVDGVKGKEKAESLRKRKMEITINTIIGGKQNED